MLLGADEMKWSWRRRYYYQAGVLPGSQVVLRWKTNRWRADHLKIIDTHSAGILISIFSSQRQLKKKELKAGW